LKHRIRAAALIVKDERILLVQGEDPDFGVHFAPPGGGLEAEDDSIPACARREAFEETGLQLGPLSLVYVREFHELRKDTLNVEMYFLAHSFTGEATTANTCGKDDEQYIKGLQWFSREEMVGVTIFPAMLKDEFWQHLQHDCKDVLYLGRESG
jgi:8-oxo-dGTP diphosphatase